jgi:hypothetical protein
MVTVQPSVTVRDFKSISFWPQRIEFNAGIVIRNNAPVQMEVRKVEWAVDLSDQELFTDTVSDIRNANPNGSLAISLPFHIGMRDVTDQAPDALNGGSLKVTFRGQVYTAARYGLDPVPFTQTIEVPVPMLPDVAYVGAEGEPFSSAFRLNFTVTNKNPFPITLMSVKTFLGINEKKYGLLHTRGSVDIQPGETQPVALRMENPPGKVLSMALNLIQNPNPRFSVTGTVTFNTPSGFIYIPLSLDEILQE